VRQVLQFGFLIFPLLYKSNRIPGCLRRVHPFQFLVRPEKFHIQVWDAFHKMQKNLCVKNRTG
jgi:hypothetical protein